MSSLDYFPDDPSPRDLREARQRVRLHKQHREWINGEIAEWRAVLTIHGASTAPEEDQGAT